MRRSLQSAMLAAGTAAFIGGGSPGMSLFDLKYPGGMFPGLVSLTGREAGEDAAILGRDYLDHQSITSMCVKVSDEMKELYD
jgi:hypothetical protein